MTADPPRASILDVEHADDEDAEPIRPHDGSYIEFVDDLRDDVYPKPIHDFMDPDAYIDHGPVERTRWAWEFLRRNADFQRDWDAVWTSIRLGMVHETGRLQTLVRERYPGWSLGLSYEQEMTLGASGHAGGLLEAWAPWRLATDRSLDEQYARTLERAAEHRPDIADHAFVAVLDLEATWSSQVNRLHAAFEARRRELGVPSRQAGKFKAELGRTYLRILDGLASGVDEARLRRAVGLFGRGSNYGSTRTRALELRDGGYRHLPIAGS